MKTSIVVPTYQERENIEALVRRLSKALQGFDHEIVIVDDDSPDGTAAFGAHLAESYPVRVVIRKGVRGLGSAILQGFDNATGDFVGVIDADLQHPPEVIPQLVAALLDGADIAIASRYTAGGRIDGWSRTRKLVSRGATALARPLVKPTRDPLSGCFMLTRSVARQNGFNTKGYKLLLEILVRNRGCRVEEIAYPFGARHNGRSKLGSTEYTRYLALLVRLYWRRLAGTVAQLSHPHEHRGNAA